MRMTASRSVCCSVAIVAANIVAIVVCGGVGAVAGYAIVDALHLSGIIAALIAALGAMVVAALAWAAGAALLRARDRLG